MLYQCYFPDFDTCGVASGQMSLLIGNTEVLTDDSISC
jgi:hypothetical protein